MIPLIDTHIHLDDDRFDKDREAICNNALAAGITAMVIPATTQKRWQKIFALTERYENVYPTAGLHPVFIDQHTDDHLADLQNILADNSCKAIGECGLDGFHKELDYEKQKHFFEQQLLIAKEVNLPLIIHARNAVQDVIQLIKSSGSTFGVIHSYNGSLEQARQLTDLGYLLSFGGAVTYDRATRLHKLVKELPLESLMVETDAPDQPPSQHKGKRNEPAYLTEIVAAIARIKGTTSAEIAQQSNANAKRLFNIQ